MANLIEVGTEQLAEMEMQQEAVTCLDRAKALVVKDQASYNEAAEGLLLIKEFLKRVDALCDPNIRRWYDGHKKAVSEKKALTDMPLQAEAIYKRGIASYIQEQERIRLEIQRKAEEEAKRREEEERLALAVQAEQAGADEQTIEDIVNTPQPYTPPVVAQTFRPMAGVSSRKTWKWRLVDESKVPRKYLVLNTVAINSAVKSLGKAADIPGIEVYEDTGIAAGRR